MSLAPTTCARRPAQGPAEGPPARQRQPGLHAPDPAVLPQAAADLLDPGNLSANWTPDIRAFANDNNIELVATPTYASYLNRVECHFLPISEFVVKDSDYLNWDASNYALARHITNRNRTHRDQRLLDLERRHQIAA